MRKKKAAVSSEVYPGVVDESLVGTYPVVVPGGGGFVWDEVLEYRVWCHPERGAPDLEKGNDYYYPFSTYSEAKEFSDATKGAEEPLVLVRQVEYIDEPEPGQYHHIKKERITEWPVEFLRRPRRTPNTIPDFLSPNAQKIDSISFVAWRRRPNDKGHAPNYHRSNASS